MNQKFPKLRVEGSIPSTRSSFTNRFRVLARLGSVDSD